MLTKNITLYVNYELVEFDQFVTIDKKHANKHAHVETLYQIHAGQYDEAADEALRNVLSTVVDEFNQFTNIDIISLHSNLIDLDNYQQVELVNVVCDYNSNQIDIQIRLPENDEELFMKYLEVGFIDYIENNSSIDIYALVQNDYGDDFEVHGVIDLFVLNVKNIKRRNK